jgi:Putative F0F1-ATPase subunit Ca2+/Mg2+ transporter
MSHRLPSNSNNNHNLIRYAGMSTQMLVVIGVSVFIGLKADRWLKLSIPLLVWLLPLLALCGIFYKIARDTSKRKKDEGK